MKNTRKNLTFVAPVAIALVATSTLTGCSSSRKEIEATSTKLEYGKEPVQSLTLIKDDTDGITASPETVDVTKVGETKVTYTSGKSSTDITYEIEDTKLILRDVIEKLPNDYREIVKLFYYEDLNQKEISEKLNINPMQVSRKLKKAFSLLYKMIADSEE